MDVGIKLLQNYGKDWGLPIYKYNGDAGMDVKAAIDRPIILKPGERKLIPTGIALEIPNGFEIQVRPRSGLALNNGITVLNTPGTIDCGFSSEIGIILINIDISTASVFDEVMDTDDYFLIPNKTLTVNPGDRVAQIVLKKVEKIEWMILDDLS